MPYWNTCKRVPDVVRLGTRAHKEAVKTLYRRFAKWSKYNWRFDYQIWDWHVYNCRLEIEKNKDLKDPGEVLRLMKQAEEALDLWMDPDPFGYPWDGPSVPAFLRYPNLPKARFDHRIGDTYFDTDWRDVTTDEYYTKKEVQKWQARYITVFRDESLSCTDYPTWLKLKKRLEEELQIKIDDIMSSMNKSWWDYVMDWPYNTVPKFSDGWVPSASLDIAFQEHWDEELWKKLAELSPEEEEAVRQYEFDSDNTSIRSHDRLLPPR